MVNTALLWIVAIASRNNTMLKLARDAPSGSIRIGVVRQIRIHGIAPAELINVGWRGPSAVATIKVRLIDRTFGIFGVGVDMHPIQIGLQPNGFAFVANHQTVRGSVVDQSARADGTQPLFANGTRTDAEPRVRF